MAIKQVAPCIRLETTAFTDLDTNWRRTSGEKSEKTDNLKCATSVSDLGVAVRTVKQLGNWSLPAAVVLLGGADGRRMVPGAGVRGKVTSTTGGEKCPQPKEGSVVSEATVVAVPVVVVPVAVVATP